MLACLLNLIFALFTTLSSLLPHAQGASKEVSSVEVRRTLSMIGVLVLVLLQVYFMLYYNYIQLNCVQYVGDHWYSHVVPPIVYYLVCNHVSVWLYPVTAMLTDFEMHPTKVCIFHFTSVIRDACVASS